MDSYRREFRFVIAGVVLPLALWAAKEAAAPINPDAYLAHIKFLASPELQGRGTGTPGLDQAAKYISNQFKTFGLKPVTGKSYYQDFTVTINAHLGPDNALVADLGSGQRKLKVETQFVPFNFSSVGKAAGGVVFAGYGITAPEYRYDDYAGIDVKDKFVLILRHEPQESDEKSVFAGKNMTSHAQFVSKASNAKMHGARGVILVNDTAAHAADQDTFEKFGRTVGPDNAGLFFVQMSTAEAEQWVRESGRDLKEIAAGIDKDLKPRSFALDRVQVHLTVDIRRDSAVAHNVAAYLPGESDEYVVIGAHYDHLGLGEKDSLAPSQVGKPHLGADDNASGTAGVIELARWFSAQPKHKRGILFLTFAGEELGLLGSAWYASHPELPLEKAVAMINMDMIGRVRDSKVFVSGVGTGSTLQKLLDDAPKHSLSVDISEKAGYGSSDHTSFTAKQVPVLFFFSGLHADYHKPSDTWDKIDAPDAVKVLGLVGDLATQLADAQERPKFVRVADPHSQQVSGTGGGSGYGAYFGSIPDFTEIPNGVKFADVKDGSPAALAGLKPGDILTEFDGKPISNLYDFTYALRAKKPGQEVLVKVLRSGTTIVAKVLLAERK